MANVFLKDEARDAAMIALGKLLEVDKDFIEGNPWDENGKIILSRMPDQSIENLLRRYVPGYYYDYWKKRESHINE